MWDKDDHVDKGGSWVQTPGLGLTVVGGAGVTTSDLRGRGPDPLPPSGPHLTQVATHTHERLLVQDPPNSRDCFYLNQMDDKNKIPFPKGSEGSPLLKNWVKFR